MSVPDDNITQQEPENFITEDPSVPKGVILKIFGVVLVFLGSLDLMLFWRGGVPIDFFHVFLLIIGAFFYAFGSFRNRYHS